MPAYIELLKDPRWQRKRLTILERDKWVCTLCSDGTRTLHVHHKFYPRGADPWDVEDEFLTTLCESCHESITNLTLMLKQSLGLLPPASLVAVLGYVDAIDAITSGFPYFLSRNLPGRDIGAAHFLGVSVDEVREGALHGVMVDVGRLCEIGAARRAAADAKDK